MYFTLNKYLKYSPQLIKNNLKGINNGFKAIKNNLELTVNWLLPNHCSACQTHLPHDATTICCNDCIDKLPYLLTSCQRCGQALPTHIDYCGHCLNQPPPFNLCFCPFQYQAPVSDLICQFKYAAQPQLCLPLSQLMVDAIKENDIIMPELLIPVPMHHSKLRQRGYNPALLLAKQLGKKLDIPVSGNTLSKYKATTPQAKLPLKKRLSNIKNSFKIKKKITAKSVAVIDDVITSGATVCEITKILRKNGVDYIQVWGIAHAS